jgi:hypothetical protein
MRSLVIKRFSHTLHVKLQDMRSKIITIQRFFRWRLKLKNDLIMAYCYLFDLNLVTSYKNEAIYSVQKYESNLLTMLDLLKRNFNIIEFDKVAGKFPTPENTRLASGRDPRICVATPTFGRIFH